MELTPWGLCVCSLRIGSLEVGSLRADSLRVWDFGMSKLTQFIGDDSNWRVIGPLFPSKILTSYLFLRELKQLTRMLRGNKKAKSKSKRENQS